MITAKTDLNDLQQAFDAGAIDYINKPPNEVVLLARVRSALKLKQEMERRKSREQELLEVSNLLEEAYRNLQHHSSLDGLTGIANRGRFDDALEREWRRAIRSSASLSLV